MTELLVPRTRQELGALAGDGCLVAGGTDLLVQMRAGRDVARLVDLSNLEDAPPPVRAHDGVVELSAVAPLNRIVSELEGRLPGLAACARLFGSLQIRNRATLGGNLSNASPAADAVPPLVVAEAVATVEGPAGTREVPVDAFAVGPGRTVLRPGEWLLAIRVPLPAGEDGFRKLGGRLALAISVVNLAWRWRRDEEGRLRDVRLAVGAAAPTVIRVPEAERELEGRRPGRRMAERAAFALKDALAPIDDVRGSAWYRREAAAGLLREALGP